MDEHRSVDQRFMQPLYLLAKAVEMKEVPLLVFDQNPFLFLEQVTEIVHGSVIYASSADAEEQLLDLLGSRSYIFLVIDAELSDPIYNAISYYLHMRDVLPDPEPELEHRYRDFAINPDNRLVLITERNILYGQDPGRRRHVQELSTVIAVQ